MYTVEFKKCLIYPDRLHVNDTCSNKFNKCWKKAFPKDYLKTKQDWLDNKDVMLINTALLEDKNETKS